MVVRFFLLMVSLILIASFGWTLILLIGAFFTTLKVGANLIGFAIGAVFFFAIWWVFQDFWQNWMGIFTHELTHAFACLLSFATLSEFVVSRGKGGWVRCSMPSTFLFLAPYILPIFAFIPLIIIPFVKDSVAPYLYGLLGFATMYHLITVATQFRFYQSDFKRVGLVASSIYVLFGNVFFLGLIVAMVAGSYPAMWEYTKDGVMQVYHWAGLVPVEWSEFPVKITRE